VSRRTAILGRLGRRPLTVIGVAAVLGAGAWAVAQPSLALTASCLGSGYGNPTGTCGPYVALPGVRILDTRVGTGGTTGPVGQTVTTLNVTGANGVPETGGASAVVLNVTVTGPTNVSDLVVWPAGQDMPSTSNLNFVPGETVANLVEVQLGNNGGVSFYNLAGDVQILADLEGYVSTSNSENAGLFNPVSATRILDTRNGTGGVSGPVSAGSNIRFPVTGGATGVPSNAGAVVFNLTATGPTIPGDITAFRDDTSPPGTSNLNFAAGQTIANRVIEPVVNGYVDLHFNPLVTGVGSVQLIADINGYFTNNPFSPPTGSDFNAEIPQRIYDTRPGPGLGAGGWTSFAVAGRGGVPAMDAASPPTAVVLNVTVVNPTTASDLTVWSSDAGQPSTSDINYVGGQTQPNLVVVALGPDGSVSFSNLFGTANLVIDVEGWYS
jgi:hypothetical protein